MRHKTANQLLRTNKQVEVTIFKVISHKYFESYAVNCDVKVTN